MDSMIAAAAQALAAGDLLGALKRVALRDDAPALALRGIALAQLGELGRARELLQQAARGFGPRETLARARCVVAEAEIALVSRDLAWQPKALSAARTVLEAHGDAVNAAHALHTEARRALLIGRIDEAESLLTGRIDGSQLMHSSLSMPPALAAGYELAVAGIAMRRLQSAAAADALSRARRAALASGIAALRAEVESAAQLLQSPVARLLTAGTETQVALADVERLQSAAGVVVDACRHEVRSYGAATVRLGARPVLFTLARMLAEAWPGDVSRHALVAGAFRAKEADESYRARLRVEIGRLRTEISAMAGVRATKAGFVLAPHGEHTVAVLAPMEDSQHGALLALLADGESWSSSALAIALDSSPRTVQRALEQLASTGKVNSFGRGRTRRHTLASVPGFPSTLLLPIAGRVD